MKRGTLLFLSLFTAGFAQAQTNTIQNPVTESSVVARTAIVFPELNFEQEYVTVNETDGSLQVNVSLSEVSGDEITVEASLLADFGSANLNLPSQTLTFPANSTDPQTITIPLQDNNTFDGDQFFVLQLSNPSNAQLGETAETVVYLLDDEKSAPVATEELEIEHAHSYKVDENGTAEIVAFDKDSKRLFVLNSEATAVEVLDFSNPKNITPISSIDMTSYGDGATSVAVQNGIVVASVEGVDFADGKVIFMDIDGNILSSVTVGNLPDMVTFTPDGNYVLTANEGEPSDDYTIDPEGSISVIDITGGVANLTQNEVSTLTFNDFDALIDEVRDADIRIFGQNATVSQDLEPEYITVSEDSKTAWVSLQENNAIATIDLESMEITEILGLGTKDHSLAGNSLDASDKTDAIIMANWPVKGLYMPDAIASYTVNNTTYVVTANEGDQREFGPINEDVSIKDDEYVLDPTVFPHADLMKKDFVLGRLAVSPYSGDLDGDGDFDEIHSFGGRSFSIFNTETGELVYDSGNDFEMITAMDPVYGELFNASNSNNNFKNRSDNKGPEPEGITVAEINGQHYAFVTLERMGGMMTYNITDPMAPEFVNYSNNRTLGADEGGDLGPEGIIYINENDSPSDTAMVVMANEVSATISVYYINNVAKKVTSLETAESNDFQAHPNPTSGKVYFNKPVSFTVHTLTGEKLMDVQDKASFDTADLDSGIYILVNKEGETTKLVVSH